jgi:hypothetical protein
LVCGVNGFGLIRLKFGFVVIGFVGAPVGAARFCRDAGRTGGKLGAAWTGLVTSTPKALALPIASNWLLIGLILFPLELARLQGIISSILLFNLSKWLSFFSGSSLGAASSSFNILSPEASPPPFPFTAFFELLLFVLVLGTGSTFACSTFLPFL